MDSLMNGKINNLPSLPKLNSFKILSILTLIIFIVTFSYIVVFNKEAVISQMNLISGRDCIEANRSLIYVESTSNNSVYFEHDMSPKRLWNHNRDISYVKYFDMGFAKDCGIPYNHKDLFKLMKFWINFTAVHNIPWWLCYGSLIGAIRHKDMVPWDSDIDLAMPVQFENLLRSLNTPRKEISNKKVNIITRPGPHCPYNGPRMDCQGNIVTSHVDGCAFCGPFLRLFYTPSKRIDVYLVDIKFHEGKLKLFDEGTFEYSSEMPYYPLQWFIPLRNCTFMGLVVQCPRMSETVLENYYKTIQSYYTCIKGKWVLIKAA